MLKYRHLLPSCAEAVVPKKLTYIQTCVKQQGLHALHEHSEKKTMGDESAIHTNTCIV
jgi:hypothetical protein